MQVPSHVAYERATSVEHALELLARFGPESRVLAGGHSLIPMMKLRLAQPETLIDINGIRGRDPGPAAAHRPCRHLSQPAGIVGRAAWKDPDPSERTWLGVSPACAGWTGR